MKSWRVTKQSYMAWNLTIDNAQWQFPIKYNIHRLGKDGQIILLGRDLQSISENQQRFVKAQIAAEESIEEKES